MTITNVQRYIEITSANRDRTRYPHPAQFITELSMNRGRTSTTARDPTFTSVNVFPPPDGTDNNYGYMYGVDINGFGIVDPIHIGILPTFNYKNGEYSPVFPSSTENQYVGNMLQLVKNVVGGVTTAQNEYQRIVDYRVLPNATQQSITTTVNGAQPILASSVSLAAGFTGTIDNYFVGWTATLPSGSRTITAYRAYDRRIFFAEDLTPIAGGDTVVLSLPVYFITLDSPFSIGALPQTNISSTNYTTFRIRQGNAVPLASGTFAPITVVATPPYNFALPATVNPLDYTNSLLSVTTNPVVLSGAIQSAGFIAVGGVQVKGTFTLTTSFPTNYFTGMIITLTSGAFSGYSYRITAWDVTTLTGTVTPGWTSVVAGTTNPAALTTFVITNPMPFNSRIITTYNVSNRHGTTFPFSYKTGNGSNIQYLPTISDTFDILQFKEDNYQPLDYAESNVHQQQPHCYEIKLVSLTLPNVPLATGGIIANYPFVYVEFRNIIGGTNAYDLNTNNPAAKNVMFKAPIIYNFQLERMKFIIADGHRMVQTLKFKPNDALQFSVYLPNGELFMTQTDYMPPSSPNPDLQISACFSLRRTGAERE